MMTGKSPSNLVLDQSVENEIKETLATLHVIKNLEITEESNNVAQASNLTPKNATGLLKNCTNTTKDCKTSKKHCSSISLTSLPPELVLLIFSYLDARFTLRVVSCVCKLFYHLLETESSWKSRFSKIWPARDSTADYSYLSSWKKICVEHEDIDRFWFSSENKLDFFSLKQHFGPVDTVHLFAEGQMCASGSRDRSIAVWNLTNLRSQEDDRKAFKCSLDGHRGWVWSLSSDPTGESRICSGSWDSLVKIWDLQGAQPEMMTIREHQAAVLCLEWKSDILITGCYDKHVRMFDLRDGNQMIKCLKFHNKPVLCMDADDKFVITGSEDKTLRIFDRRAAKFYKSIQLESPAFSVSRNSSSGYNYLRVGGRDGKIYYFDTARDSFDVIEPCMDLGTFSRGKITGICHYGGAVVACSTDGTIKVLEPSRVPSLICSLDKHTQEVTSVHSKGGILASCSSDLTVGIWRPESLCPSSYMR